MNAEDYVEYLRSLAPTVNICDRRLRRYTYTMVGNGVKQLLQG